MRRFAVIVSLVAGSALCAFVLSGCPEEGKEKPADTAEPAKPEPAPKPADVKEPALKQVDEVEPNEKTSQAMPIAEASEVKAKLEAAEGKGKRSVDWYKVAPGAKKVVSVKATGVAGENLELSFLDRDKNPLFSVDSGGEGEPESYPNLTVADEVYLKVSGSKGGAGGDYRLAISMSDPKEGFEEEYNGRYSTANALALGQSVKGYLSHMRDEDWYLLELKDMPTGSVLRIELSAVDKVRFALEALDKEERAPILKTKSSETGQGIMVRNMGVPGTPEAIYLVIKSSWVAQGKGKSTRTYNPEIAYSLTVSSEAGGDDLEKEPNDDYNEAFELVDGQKVRGYLSSANDVDLYKIEVERPSLLAAELSGLNRVNLRLQVIDPEKKKDQRNYELVRVDDGEVGEEEVLTNCALQPGTNYLRVDGSFKKVDGKWTRIDYNLDETYELKVNLRTDDGREEREPNKTPKQATPITVGGTLRGTLHPKGDVDTFKLDLSGQDGPRNTLIECTGIPKVDISAKLLGPEMDDKGNHKAVASSAKGKGEEKEQVSSELMPGEYFIVISGKPRNESNTRDQYVLTVTQP
ncbi:MAG: PPC domain-containing protein [Deltaproteobacteria bacterium]|nr:PPC domain-containing protein [Deltaproteobacteria bacterium]